MLQVLRFLFTQTVQQRRNTNNLVIILQKFTCITREGSQEVILSYYTMKIQYFNIANFRFALHSSSDITLQFSNFKPFATSATDSDNLLFSLKLDSKVSFDREVIHSSDELLFNIAKCKNGYSIEFSDIKSGKCYLMEFGLDMNEFRTNMPSDAISPLLDNMIMLAYTFATASHDALLIHSSVVVIDGKAYLFLGKSGTGKSTHANLWLKNIEGATHLNDDNPILLYKDGKAYAAGSAWSGKGRIYKNEMYEVGGIVRLSQAPYNKMERRVGAKAFALVYTSCSKLPWDEGCMEAVCASLAKIVAVAPVYYLECLPNDEAAILSYNTMK